MVQATIVESDDELRECLAIRETVFIQEQHVPQELEIDELDHATKATHILLRDSSSGHAIATLRLKRYGEDTAKIQRVAVLKPRRQSGLGRQLMDFAEQVARRQGYRRATLDAQLFAEGFYYRLGYHRTSDDIFLDAGIEHVTMTKLL